MSPFRHILRTSGVRHPVGYSLLMLAAGMIVCMLAAVTISVKASEHAIHESERRQCESLRSDLNAYREVPPTTPTGQNQMRAKTELFRIWGCPDKEIERPEDERNRDRSKSSVPGF